MDLYLDLRDVWICFSSEIWAFLQRNNQTLITIFITRTELQTTDCFSNSKKKFYI